MPAELTILLLNAVLIVVCYQLLYPRQVGSSRVRLIINDAIATVVALMVAYQTWRPRAVRVPQDH